MTYRISRYRVSGLQDGVPVYTLFKCVKPALVFADRLSEAEIYDTISKDYVKKVIRKPVFNDVIPLTL